MFQISRLQTALALFLMAWIALSSGPVSAQGLSPVPIGRASNLYSVLRTEQNQVHAVDSLGLVGFIHRQDITVWGGGTSDNGVLRFDFSTDAGASWTSDVGPITGIGSSPYPRYPQMTFYAPGVLTSADETKLIYTAPSNYFPDPGWAGPTQGTVDWSSSPATAIPNEVHSPENNSTYRNSLCQGSPGTFFTVEQLIDENSDRLDTIRIHKGQWNGSTEKVEWNDFQDVTPNWNTSYNGGIHSIDPMISFSPDGQVGWIALLGDLVGGRDSVLSPIFIRSTDAGVTWSNPVEVDLNQFPWMSDTLQTFWINIDSTGDTVPSSNGIATCAFDFDLTVDSRGNPHLGVVIGTSDGFNFSFHSGLSKYMVDIHGINHGSSFGCEVIAPVLAFRGYFGSPNPVTMDNHPQVSRSPDGDYIFYSWVDTDTAVTGIGVSNNRLPNLRIAGRNALTGERTCYQLVTDGDPIWDGKALFPTMAPEVLTTATGFELPIVAAEMLYGDPEQPCQFYYFGGDCRIELGDFTAADMNLDWGLGCLGTGGGGYTYPINGLIEGQVFVDLNGNAVMDPTEYYAQGIKVRTDSGDVSLTNSQGEFSFSVPVATYALSTDLNPSLFSQTLPANHAALSGITLDPTAPFNTGNLFGVGLIPGTHDVMVSVQTTPHRAAYSATHTVTVTNTGTEVYSGNVGYRYDGLLDYVSASVPPNYNQGDSLNWAISYLLPQTSTTFEVVFDVDNWAVNGAVIPFKAHVAPGWNGDKEETDNTFSGFDRVMATYVPAEKSVFPVGYHQEEVIADSTWLVYQIRFQNLSNATVTDVRVVDTLSADLDFETFATLGATHPYNLKVRNLADGRVRLTWLFENVYLPNYLAHESGSQGAITFRIKPLAATPAGTVIENTAFVYMDSNPVLVTNTPQNRVDLITVLDPESGAAVLEVFPNPFSEVTTFRWADDHDEAYSIKLYDIHGRELRSHLDLEGREFRLEREGLPAGVYSFRVLRSGQHPLTGKLIVQ